MIALVVVVEAVAVGSDAILTVRPRDDPSGPTTRLTCPLLAGLAPGATGELREVESKLLSRCGLDGWAFHLVEVAPQMEGGPS